MSIIRDIISYPVLLNSISDNYLEPLILDNSSYCEKFLENDYMYLCGLERSITKRMSLFTNKNLQLSAVKWLNGCISLYESKYDAISFQFQGCLMARFRFKDKYYVAHIHCSRDFRLDRRKEWSIFIQTYKSYISDLKIFKPGFFLGNDYSGDVWGVITRNGRCFTLCVSYSRGDEWHLESVFEHICNENNPQDYKALLAFSSVTAYNFVKFAKRLDNTWSYIKCDKNSSLI